MGRQTDLQPIWGLGAGIGRGLGIGGLGRGLMDMATEIISDLELEHIINSLRGCGLDDVGGKEWVEQERNGKLSLRGR